MPSYAVISLLGTLKWFLLINRERPLLKRSESPVFICHHMSVSIFKLALIGHSNVQTPGFNEYIYYKPMR